MITRNWKNILAWGSLCLNIILIGFILIGPPRFGPPPGPPNPEKVLKHIGRDLTGKDKDVFTALLKKHAPHLKHDEKGMHAAFDRINEAAKQTPLDVDKVRIAHKGLSTHRTVMDQAIENFIVEILQSISEEGRMNLHLGPPDKPKD